MQVKFGTETEHKRVYARNIVRAATLPNMAVMLSFGCLCYKKKITLSTLNLLES